MLHLVCASMANVTCDLKSGKLHSWMFICSQLYKSAALDALVFCLLQQVWLQEVAWTEADKPVKLAARSNMLPKHHKMEQQPVFCYETMLKLLYWSCLVYDHNRVRPLPHKQSWNVIIMTHDSEVIISTSVTNPQRSSRFQQWPLAVA